MNDDKERNEYLLRSYPLATAKQMVKNGTLSEFDERMLSAITKMKDKYKEHTNRRQAVLLTPEDLRSIQNKKPILEKKETKQKPVVCVQICEATKMNGEKCTAKAKPDCKYCGRHLPK